MKLQNLKEELAWIIDKNLPVISNTYNVATVIPLRINKLRNKAVLSNIVCIAIWYSNAIYNCEVLFILGTAYVRYVCI